MSASLVLAYPIVHQVLPPATEERCVAFVKHPAAIRFTPALVRDINLQFVGTDDVLDDAYAFAANGDVSGRPPVYILNSEADDLRSSGEAYAEQLRAAGVEVVVAHEPGTKHGHLNEPEAPGGQRSVERIASWLTRR